MFKHIIYQHPTKDTLAVMGLDYLNPSDVRKWTRPGKMQANNKSPIFTEPDGTEHRYDDGGLICPDDDLLFADDNSPVSTETTEEFVRRVADRHVPDGVAYEIIDTRTAVMPSDRIFRNAWKMNSGNVDVDMPKARVIHMEKIRGARDKKLTELDVPYMKALESDDNAKKNTIAAEKQALRDLPETFDLSACNTPEELVDAWPDDLERSV